MRIMKSIMLFGPFIGSLSWEFYRFAPFVIFLKNIYPERHIAVLTRPERFDLYGQYANYLVPLKLDKNDKKQQMFFTIKDFDFNKYGKLIIRFNTMYSKRFFVDDHYYPDISDFRYKVRWQFSKSNMCYDFQPRIENKILVDDLLKTKKAMLIIPNNNEHFQEITEYIDNSKLRNNFSFFSYGYSNEIFKDINSIKLNNNISQLGIIIELIKRSVITISPKSDITHLSLLLKVPVLSWGNKINLNLINPYDTVINMSKTAPSIGMIKKVIGRISDVKKLSSYNSI